MMSLRQSYAAWRVELDPTDKFVLIFLADIASDDGTFRFPPTIPTVMKHTCMAKSTVQRAYKSLEGCANHPSYLNLTRGAGRRKSELSLTLPAHLLAEYDNEKAKRDRLAGYLRKPASTRIFKNHLDQFLGTDMEGTNDAASSAN